MNNELKKLIKLEAEVRQFGFEWPNTKMILDQMISECKEVECAYSDKESPERIQEEIGDIIHTAISLCMFAGYDVENTLEKIVTKFQRRFDLLKQVAQERGYKNLHNKDIEAMLEMWKEVKKKESQAQQGYDKSCTSDSI